MNISVRSVQDKIDIKTAKQLLLYQSLGYPKYEDWVSLAIGEIHSSYKTCLLGFSDGVPVANFIYQPHKEISLFRELKNLRIMPPWRHRGLASFMIKQAEVEDTENLAGIVCDVRESETDIIGFLTMLGYQKIAGLSLYDPNVKDIVMVKPMARFGQISNVYDKLIK